MDETVPPRAILGGTVGIVSSHTVITEYIHFLRLKNANRNELVIEIQPSTAVYLKLNSKMSGFDTGTVLAHMDLSHDEAFTGVKVTEAYEALIYDVLKGNHSNFVRDDELEAAWEVRKFFHLRRSNDLMSILPSGFYPAASHDTRTAGP